MSDTSLKQQLTADMKSAMKDKDKQRLTTIRLILSATKQVEVDERIDPDDERITSILDKMVKQRRESIKQYEDGGRPELAAIEQAEIDVLQEFMPEQLDEAQIDTIIADALKSTGAASMQDMGKVMGVVKPHVTGRADMGLVSKKVKDALS